MTNSLRYKYRDLSGLISWMNRFGYLLVALALVGLVVIFFEIDFYRSGTALSETHIAMERLTVFDDRIFIWSIFFLPTLAIFKILFFRWNYLSCKNARSFEVEGFSRSPGWFVGWYFIPIFHLWKPVVIMQEMFQVSCSDSFANWKNNAIPLSVYIWWPFVILNWILEKVSRLGLSTEEFLDKFMYTGSTWLDFTGCALLIPFVLTTLCVVWDLQKLQNEKNNLRESGASHQIEGRTGYNSVGAW